MVATDCMGPYPKCKGGYAYVVVFRDSLSKWTQCVLLRKANVKTIRRALKDTVVYRWGTPEVFFTDKGIKSMNKEMAKAASDLGKRHTTTPPYHAQANPVERPNRIMKTMIASFIEENHQDWNKHLSEFRFAINITTHSSLKTSPAFMKYGREPRPPRTIKGREEGQLEVIELSMDEWKDRAKRLQALLDLVTLHLDRHLLRIDGSVIIIRSIER